MKARKYLTVLAIVFATALAFGQPRSFSKKPEVFIVEVSNYIGTKSTSEIDAISKLFTEKWNANAFNETEQRIIIKACNGMLINKLDVPDFSNLQQTVMIGKDSVGGDKFDSWMKALVPAVRSGNKTLLTLLNSSKLLFKDNTLYSSSTKDWISSKNNYEFQFIDNRVRISFENIDLTCKAQVDEIVIYNTSGSYYLDEDEWVGSKGKITWQRVGFGNDNVFVEIPGTYKVRFNRAEIEADSVLHTNKGFLDNPVLGRFKDRASSADEVEKNSLQASRFPQFFSYQQDLALGSYLEGRVRFRGGYAIKGSEIIAQGSSKNPSIIEIDYKGKLRVSAVSEHFSLKENRLTARNCAITLMTDSGEIYHPKVRFNLNLEKKILLVTRGKEGLEKAPFFDSDHEVEIFVDQVIWDLEQPKIDFKMASKDSRAIVESRDFYKDIRYEKITRGMMAYHPLSKMRDFVIRHRKREFTFTEYATWMRSKQIYLKPQIIQLADLGYLFFNPATDSIKVRRKLDNAVLAHKKLKDYDVLRFSSVIGAKPNGFLNLINNTFVLEGVRGFKFSDSQSVYAFPHEQMVILKNKRRMEFGGRLTAGKFDFYGQKFEFDYNDFTVNSDQIDSMRIFTKDLDGKNRLVAIKSVLRDINGTLEIDKSTNKSGLEDYPEYPRFTSRKGSVIAYDKKHIFNGAYKKDVFRFEVDPFTLTDMDDFIPQDLKFPGSFVSGGILPEFRYEAGIMDDYSLGFEKVSPPGGYPMYGGAGQGEIDIKLSEEGFTAKGTINYQGAEMVSNAITMMPDSTLAEVDSYTIKENSKYPNVTALDVLTRWLPNKDSMFINTNEHTVKVLRDGQEFAGNLIQTSSQLAGYGELTWDQAKLSSKDMKFKPNMVDALESEVQIGSISSDKIAFASSNMNSHVDFNTRIGDFKSNEKGKLTDFPFNAYASSMDEYKWDMDAHTIELNKGPLLSADESFFVSKNPDQNGLKFQSTKALFNMDEGVIYAENVPHIDVADSRVFPDEGKVVLEENAHMRTLEKARMLAARGNKYHNLYDGSINISGRYQIGGSAYIKFKDKHETGQVIYLNKMRVKDDSTVVAGGFLQDTIGFTISPKIAYKGKVELWSNQEDLKFNGYVKPLHTFEQFPSEFFRFQGQPDPKNVIIPAKEPKNQDKRTMALAVSIANDSTHVYPSFFNFKRSYADLSLIRDSGVLYYNEEENRFYAGDSGKLFDGELRGSFLSFDEDNREVYSEGKIDFGLDLGPKFNGVAAGNLSKKESDSTFVINMLMGLNMSLPDECFDRMVEVFTKYGDGLPQADNNSDFVQRAMAEYLDDKKLDKALADVETTNALNASGELDRDVLFSKMSLHYSPARKAFISMDKIHVASIKGKQVNRKVESRIVMTRKRSGTRFTLYMQITKYDWFYFDYYLGTFNVASTDKEFNTSILEDGVKMSKGRFRIRTASPRTVSNFLSKLEE